MALCYIVGELGIRYVFTERTGNMLNADRAVDKEYMLWELRICSMVVHSKCCCTECCLCWQHCGNLLQLRVAIVRKTVIA